MKNRWKIILLISVLFIVGVVALGLYQNQPQNRPPKDQADAYFEIVIATLDEGIPANENGTVFKITQVTFRFKAVKGDAHNVVVYGWGISDVIPNDGRIPTMLKGEEQNVTIYSDENHPYLSTQNADGKYPVIIRITSSEAEGRVTLQCS